MDKEGDDMVDFWQEASNLKDAMVKVRRDFHQHPESAWTEFRTASQVAETLSNLSYEVLCGEDFIHTEDMVGVPPEEKLQECKERALREGALSKWLDKMPKGKTAVVGIMHFNKPGKVVCLRFDMDCNTTAEDLGQGHLPTKEGFNSLHEGLMHACGHDGHTTIGLFVAKLLSEHKDELCGTVKIFFQPAEEGAGGAKALVGSGLFDDCDYFLSGHIGLSANRDDLIVCMATDFLATTKMDVEFHGLAAHAGANPEMGKNALLAAAKAILLMQEVPKEVEGLARLNVGTLDAGSARNIIPDKAVLRMETRGATSKIDTYLYNRVKEIVKECGDSYGCTSKVIEIGRAPSEKQEPELAKEIFTFLKSKGIYKEVLLSEKFGASEDCTRIMERVQEKGGHAIFMMYGSKLPAVHHNSSFDFNEDLLPKAVGTVAILTNKFLHK